MASPFKTLGWASDYLVMTGLSALTVASDRVIWRTPSEPDFWFGNLLVFRDGTIDPQRQIAQFKADFPQAGHITFGWDVPDLDDPTGLARLRKSGLEVETTHVLALSGSPPRAPVPHGLSIHSIDSDTHWRDVLALSLETAETQGYAREDHKAFLEKRIANRREQIAKGRACWLGAFDGEVLAGCLGIFADARTARFQAVATAQPYRRQGVCAGLITAALDWAHAKEPDATPVIMVDDSNEAAARVYRRAGFTHHETLVSALKTGL